MYIEKKNRYLKYRKNISLGNYQPPIPKEKLSDWYHGTLDRMEAIRMLRENGEVDGSFLVRFSSRNNGMYVLSVMYHKHAFHFQIQKKVRIK